MHGSWRSGDLRNLSIRGPARHGACARLTRIIAGASLLLVAGCAGSARSAAVTEPALPREPVHFPHPVAWSAVPNLRLEGEDGTEFQVPNLFTRLEVQGSDSLGVRVSCPACGPSVVGYASPRDLVAEALPPEVAAWGPFPEFLLAVRAAAIRRDLEALRTVMTHDFTSSFFGVQTPDAAFRTWEAEDFRGLDDLPVILDQGVATRDSLIWAAPPVFVNDIAYQGPRAGFRRNADGRWEWLYLVRSIADRR